jgi:predicted metal-dependent hydrolase
MPLLPGPPPLDITLRRSARARRFSLRVSRLDGRVTLSLPPGAREAEAMAFARQQESWIRRALADLPSPAPVGLGAQIAVEGRLLRLESGPGRLVRIEGDSLLIPGNPAQAGVRAGAFLKHLARDRLTEASDRYAQMIGRPYSRLVMAPPAVLDYVAAHEVAHLAQMNHSPAFWAVVARLVPGYAAHRRWLKLHGQALHGPRFASAGD